MKICDICGCENFSQSNFCIHCGNKISKDNYCPKCGKLNEDVSNFCIYCNFQLKPVAINSFDNLFSDYNLKLLENYQLSEDKYYKILNEVFEKANYINITGDSIKDKILKICNVFARCAPKTKENDFGYNFADVIRYDERLSISKQIATLIHELTHCLLHELISDILCDIFQVKRSPIIDSFTSYFLFDPINLIFNEYCASTVEGRFIPFGYQNYGSFFNAVNSTGIGDDYIDILKVFGNSFAYDISLNLEKFITEDLREDIKYQFKIDDDKKNPNKMSVETKIRFDFVDKSSVLLGFLNDSFIKASMPENREELYEFLAQLEDDRVFKN